MGSNRTGARARAVERSYWKSWSATGIEVDGGWSDDELDQDPMVLSSRAIVVPGLLRGDKLIVCIMSSPSIICGQAALSVDLLVLLASVYFPHSPAFCLFTKSGSLADVRDLVEEARKRKKDGYLRNEQAPVVFVPFDPTEERQGGDGRTKMPLSPTVAGSEQHPFGAGYVLSGGSIQFGEPSSQPLGFSHSISSGSLVQLQFGDGTRSFWAPNRGQMLQSRRSQSREDLSSSVEAHMVKV
ncbi:hypothetical protein M5K25_020067 [Dendrobium thyrsiflorum]|uniref:Uncharacterized protein n=1 Tax=Dendrobium thyrsiflorum TaxID=117978 RepID=A0ABD0U932_DENTH